jgi:hypothetical protein
MFIGTSYFFLFRSQHQIVMPIRMTEAMSQMTKEEVGNGPALVPILMKAIIPVTTTMMVSVRGILKDSFIFLLSFLTHDFAGWSRSAPGVR